MKPEDFDPDYLGIEEQEPEPYYLKCNLCGLVVFGDIHNIEQHLYYKHGTAAVWNFQDITQSYKQILNIQKRIDKACNIIEQSSYLYKSELLKQVLNDLKEIHQELSEFRTGMINEDE